MWKKGSQQILLKSLFRASSEEGVEMQARDQTVEEENRRKLKMKTYVQRFLKLRRISLYGDIQLLICKAKKEENLTQNH